MVTETADSANSKQSRYRARLRQQGLRPVQIWVPDSRIPGFAEACRRQAERINQSAEEPDALDFIDAAADWGNSE